MEELYNSVEYQPAQKEDIGAQSMPAQSRAEGEEYGCVDPQSAAGGGHVEIKKHEGAGKAEQDVAQRRDDTVVGPLTEYLQ